MTTKQHDFILLDRSGSMLGMWDEAISSINTYVKKLLEEKVNTKITLIAFDKNGEDSTFEVIRDAVKPKKWNEVSSVEIKPRGMTPLNDAAARMLDRAEAGNFDKVAIIVMTDGAENSSKEYTTAQIKDRFDKAREKGWAIVFLGANFDNVAQAASYGTAVRHTLNSSVGNMAAAASAMATARGLYASGATATMSFTDEQRMKLKKNVAYERT